MHTRTQHASVLLIEKVGGRDRDRTGDPLLAKQVLSQLSYTPPQRKDYSSILSHLPRSANFECARRFAPSHGLDAKLSDAAINNIHESKRAKIWMGHALVTRRC
jgi:hypothetical protein